MNKYKTITMILILHVFFLALITYAEPSRPLIFIPGILGTKLYEGNRLIWGDRSSYYNFERLRLKGNNNDNIKPNGIIEGIKILGPFKVKQYSTLIRFLEKNLGYKKKENLFIFDYDWRRSNFYNAKILNEEINKNPKLKVGQFDIIAHSMGGLVGRILIDEYKTGERVKNFITMGTPFLGSLDSIDYFINGFNWKEKLLSLGQDSEEVRSVFFSFESVYELLPGPFWKTCCRASSNLNKFINIFDITYWKHWWLPTGYNDMTTINMIRTGLKKREMLANIVRKPFASNNTYHVAIASSMLKTKSIVKFDAKGNTEFVGELSGDQSVTLRSATIGKNSRSRVSFAKHAHIFDDKTVRENLRRILIVGDLNIMTNFSGISGCSYDSTKQCMKIGDSEISKFSLDVKPDIAFVNDQITIIMELKIENEKELNKFEPSCTIYRADSNQSKQIMVNLKKVKESNPWKPQYNYIMRICEEGDYIVSLNLEKVTTIEDYFLVFNGGSDNENY